MAPQPRSILWCGILSLVLGGASWGAEDLAVGQRVDGALEKNSKAEYLLELQSGHFVYGEVEQNDVDIKLTIYDPTGTVVGLYDGPARGAEPFSLDTESEGQYRLEVSAVDDQSGQYSLTVHRDELVATDPAERLQQLLSAYEGDDVPGAVVAVIRGGKVVHSNAVGMANLTFAIPFTRETVSNIGSVSKQFTAFAVTRLAQTEALSLDDDVRKHFPELPNLGETVTVRDLLRHTSGYRECLNLLGMSGRRLGYGDYIDRDEVIAILQRQTALQDPPGTQFNYNNSAYSLAALLVERVAGVPFPQWLAENLFQPLGMSHTRIRASTGEIVLGGADGYLYGEEVPFRQATDLGGGGGATMGPGGIYTTVDDLALWIANLRSGTVGGQEVIAEMTRPQIKTPGEDSHYGLGLFLDRHRGLELIHHGGADTAHRAELLYYPEINAAVLAMSNHGGFSGSIARETAEAFFGERMDPEAPATTPESSTDDASATTIEASAFEPFVGKYEFDDYPGIVIDVSLVEGQVMIQVPGDDPQPVSPTSATTLSSPPDASIEFHRNAEGEVDSLTLQSDADLVAHRLEAWSPESEDLAEYEGSYFSEELSTFYVVKMGETGLVITHRRLDDIELVAKVKDSFNCSDVLAEVAFLRNDDGALTGMMASNVRTRNVWFERVD